MVNQGLSRLAGRNASEHSCLERIHAANPGYGEQSIGGEPKQNENKKTARSVS
jgi:hypothetical protein